MVISTAWEPGSLALLTLTCCGGHLQAVPPGRQCPMSSCLQQVSGQSVGSMGLDSQGVSTPVTLSQWRKWWVDEDPCFLIPWGVITEVSNGVKPQVPTVTGALTHPAWCSRLSSSIPPPVPWDPLYSQILCIGSDPDVLPKVRHQENLS